MKIICIVFVLFLSQFYALGKEYDLNRVLNAVNEEIKERDSYQVVKEKRIADLKKELNESNEFNIYNQLFDEYKYYQNDSSYMYARRLEAVALKSGKNIEKAIAQSALLFCYKSVGFFKEATDIISNFDPSGLPDELLMNFYLLCAHTYQNLSSYVNGTLDLSAEYDKLKIHYYELALKYAPEYSFYYTSIALEIALIKHYSDELAIEERKSLIVQYKLEEHEMAVQYSILSSALDARNCRDEAIYYRALSVLSDIRSCTHETTSAKVLAEYMYERNELSRAHNYIYQALYDAQFYNSRLRMVEINLTLSNIENSRYNWLNRQRLLFLGFGSLVLILLIITFVLSRQLRKKNKALYNIQLKLLSNADVLRETNSSLTSLNEKLKETSEIKDRYIIQSLHGNSYFVNEIEKHTKSLLVKIRTKQYDDAKTLLYNMGIKTERERLYTSFDTAFLSLFPNFIDAFNALFPESEWIQLEKNDSLPMEVRIFAMMRIGIDKASEVAEYLNLSVNTVYVYKANIKNKSLVSKDRFDAEIMAIPKP